MAKSYQFEVILKPGWTRALPWLQLKKWFKDNSILDDDWVYMYPHIDSNDHILSLGFTYGDDALLFKLQNLEICVVDTE